MATATPIAVGDTVLVKARRYDGPQQVTAVHPEPTLPGRGHAKLEDGLWYRLEQLELAAQAPPTVLP